jgi:hypothetical protein
MGVMIKPALQGAGAAIALLLFVVGLLTVLDWFVPLYPQSHGPRRSGLIYFIDPDTDCHYVSGGVSLIPRLRADGRPMCGSLP